MGFFEEIQRLHGRDMVRDLKEYSNNSIKVAKLKNRRIFLLKCRKQGIIPTHIKNNLKKFQFQFEYKDAKTGHQVATFTSRLGNKVINLEIEITHKNLLYLECRQTSLKDKISIHLSENDWLVFAHKVRIKSNKIFHQTRVININKFNKLRNEQREIIVTQQSWLKNLSDVELPQEISTILSLGPKFCLPPNKYDIKIPNLLSAINQVTDSIEEQKRKDILTSKFINIITNFMNGDHINNSYLLKMFQKTKIFLKEHPELIVIQSDKGNVTTIMKRDQYNRLAQNQLDNEENYQRLSKDPSHSTQLKANNLVSELKKRGQLNAELASQLMYYKGNAAQFYGLPKIHKDNLDLRPIIASLDSPNCMLAEFIKDILTKAYNFNNEFYVKDSFDFVDFINDRVIPENFVLVSWDVISLFTNITIELAEESIDDNWNNIQDHCPISKQNFMRIIRFVFDTTIFSFNGTYYKQKQGTPMGSSVSPIIAVYVLDFVLKKSLPKLPFRVPFLKKFMDDIITAIPADQIQQSLNIMNQFNPKIQFTVETENNNSVPFLDILVIRENNRLLSDWYRKSMSSGRYLNWSSYHPIKMKINVVKNLKSRISKISHNSFKEKNFKILEDLLLKNGYPKKWLRRIIYNIPDNIELNINDNPPDPDISLTQENTQKQYLIIPYEEHLTKRIKSLIPIDKFKIATKNVKTIRSIFTRVKDSINDLNKSDVVYKINCIDCDKCYIGQTKTKLKQRIALHKSNIRTYKDTCALSIHANSENHQPDLNNVKILDIEKNDKKRTFIEMFRIWQHDNSMNFKKDINRLSSMYSYLMDIDSIRNKPPDRVIERGSSNIIT